ncbi:hypothetical protein AB0J83_03470 [Actinoplanes sp. NPDC049596]|uniref:hypothetical protein n=1 Tax=unclassified Actinoplanes TaxID=2626549 RepID=UPI0034256B7D
MPLPKPGEPGTALSAALQRTHTVAAILLTEGSLTAQARATETPDTVLVAAFWPQKATSVLIAGQIAGRMPHRHLDGEPLRFSGDAALNNRIGRGLRWLHDLLPRADNR